MADKGGWGSSGEERCERATPGIREELRHLRGITDDGRDLGRDGEGDKEGH